MRLLLLVLLMNGCGMEQRLKVVPKHNSVFNPYIQLFTDATNHKVKIPIAFSSDFDSDTSGKCSFMKVPGSKHWNYKHVLINPMHWEKFSESQRLLVISHELIHCINQVDHEEVVPAGYKYNIMSPSYNFRRLLDMDDLLDQLEERYSNF